MIKERLPIAMFLFSSILSREIIERIKDVMIVIGHIKRENEINMYVPKSNIDTKSNIHHKTPIAIQINGNKMLVFRDFNLISLDLTNKTIPIAKRTRNNIPKKIPE